MKVENLYREYRKYRRGLKIFSAGLAICAGLFVFYWQTTNAREDTPYNWGMADAKEININSKVAGRVLELYVAEGDYVEKGQLIAKIDTDTQKTHKQQALAALAGQYAQLNQVIIASQSAERTLDANVQVALAQKSQAQTTVDLAAKEEERYRQLLNEDAVSRETYDIYRAKLEEAEAALRVAQAGVDSAEAALLKNEENKSLEDAARQQAEVLRGALDEVGISLAEAEIRAPYSGIITKKYVEEGALISGAVPLYSLQDKGDNWVDFKVKETELADYSVGDAVTLTSRNDDLKIKGHIESIRRKADFATQKATSERGEADIIAFNVKVRTDDERIWPGMRFRLAR